MRDIPGTVLEYYIVFLLLHCVYKACLWFNIPNMSCAYLEKWVIWTHTYSFKESKKSLRESVHPVSEVEMLIIESASLLRCCYHCGMFICSNSSRGENLFTTYQRQCIPGSGSYTWILSSLFAVGRSNIVALLSALGSSACNQLRYWKRANIYRWMFFMEIKLIFPPNLLYVGVQFMAIKFNVFHICYYESKQQHAAVIFRLT